jgi:hypothetical protein
MKKEIISILLILVCINLVSSAPTISSVTGTIATGNIITINGTYMIDENTTGWQYSENFGGYETISYFPKWGYAGNENGIYMGSYFDEANSCTKDGITKLLGNYSAHKLHFMVM